jgi:uncharacterized protein
VRTLYANRRQRVSGIFLYFQQKQSARRKCSCPIAVLIKRQGVETTRNHRINVYLRIVVMTGFFQRSSQIAILALSVIYIAVSPSLAEAAKKTPALISLTGVGEISALPDIARINSGVISQAKSATKALAANSAAMTRIIDDLKAAAIEAKDIQTTGFSVTPTYFYDQKNRQNPPKIVGYQVTNQIKITIRQLDQLGTILDKVIALGANQINGISFAVDQPQKLLDEARKLAVRDALHKADIYMAASKSKLGRIVTISEGKVPQPVPQFAQRAQALSAQASVPIEAGERNLRVQVNITWELK